MPVDLITDMSFAKYSSYIPRQKRTAIRAVEKIGNGVINEILPFYTRLSPIKKLLRIIQIT